MDETTSGRPALGRRSLLRAAAFGAAGLGAAVLIGCGKEDSGSNGGGTGAAGISTATATTSEDGVIQDPNLPYPFQYRDTGTPKAGGTMRMGTTYGVSIFDPAKTSAGGTLMITNFAYNRLLGFPRGQDADPFRLELTPELAETWERSPDGMSYTFKLVPNAKYHNIAPLDGRTLTSDDVKFSYDRYAAGGAQASYFENVDSVEAVDPTTVRINMKRPVADFLMPLAGRYIPILPPELVDAGTIERTAIGTGPMILREAVDGQQVVFEKNPDYWQSEVLLDRYEYRIMPDPQARLAAFRAKQIDYGYPFLDNISAVRNLEQSNPDVKIHMASPVNTTFTVAFNLDLPKYQDDRVRQALALAIDHPVIIQIIYEQLGTVLPSMPWPHVFDAPPTGEQLGRFMQPNADEAKKLLSAAGADGLQINSNYYQYLPANGRIAELLVDHFRQIGVTLRTELTDYTEFNSQWIGASFADATTSGWGTVGYDADNFFYNQIHSKASGNRWRIKDAQTDQWAEEQQVELDPEKRREIHRKIWDHHMEKQFRLFLPVGYTFHPLQPHVRGIRGGNVGNTISYDDGPMVAGGAWLDV